MALPVHAVHLSVNASGLADIDRVAAALEWLLGIDDCVEAEKTPSFHGSPMFLLTASADSKGKARRMVPRFGTSTLDSLASDLQISPSNRIDENNSLHLRLDLDALTAGRIELVDAASTAEVIKVRIKLEVYPGDKPEEVALRLITEAREKAERNGLPEPASEWLLDN
jgi:RNA binding exosome subunit